MSQKNFKQEASSSKVAENILKLQKDDCEKQYKILKLIIQSMDKSKAFLQNSLEKQMLK